MSVVFVHGIPETPKVWDLLAARLSEGGHDDQTRLSPPGFGAAVPNGFGATVFDYRDWLIGELEHFEDPVDLVGHDLGGGLCVIVAMTRPDLIRSWCSDAIGLFDPDYVWHRYAKIWQTPVVGEASIALYRMEPAAKRAAPQISMGMEPAIATEVAAAFDAQMGRCILQMYRSAVQPVMANLGANLEDATTRPGLLIMPSEDHAVGTDEQRRRSAIRAGARVEVLQGSGHWWMTEDEGRRGSAVLDAFWSSLANGKVSK
ncbi:MAG: alpha/beta hydrolase [Actinomycetota bacterium]|nr:alpha/beta hydrolase [Actinomycetota bacterium]